MADTYSTRNRFKKPESGAYNNAWAAEINGKIVDMVDESVDGTNAFTLSGTKTLTSANGTTDEARCRVQHITSGTGGTVTIPAVQKAYLVVNEASGAVAFTCGGVQASVPADSTLWVYCNGTDCWVQTAIEYSAALEANYKATSATSLTIGSGTKNLTCTSGKTYQAGDYVKISAQAAPSTKWMYGTVTSYNSSTGAMVAEITEFGTIDTLASWYVSLSGAQGADGDTLPTLSGNAYKTLRVNSAAGATEWVANGWTQIGATVTVTAQATMTISSLDTYTQYQDFLIWFDFTPSGVINCTAQVTVDASTFDVLGSSLYNTSSRVYGFVLLNGAHGVAGHVVGGSTTSAPPRAIALTANNHGSWIGTTETGITAVKFNQGGANTHTGTYKLFGRIA